MATRESIDRTHVARGSFLRFSVDTKQTRVLRYVSFNEKGPAFMVPDEGTRDMSKPNDPRRPLFQLVVFDYKGRAEWKYLRVLLKIMLLRQEDAINLKNQITLDFPGISSLLVPPLRLTISVDTRRLAAVVSSSS